MASVDGEYDLVVIGTGWHGLVAAKVYLELHPSADIVLLEAENTVGGTWSEERLYPGLKSNNLLGTYEYPDYPMRPEVYGVQPGEHIPAAVLHRYLTDFAKKFGLHARTKFNTHVDVLAKDPAGGWQISATGPEKRAEKLHAKKVIVAAGLTSAPNFPHYPGEAELGVPYIHAKDFCRHGGTIKTAQDVVIFGGAKSAFDIAYAYADAGVPNVTMVIRKNGNGPIWISYPWVMGGKKRLEQLLCTRWMTWFSPNIFGGVDGYGWVRRFLHGTAVGRFVVRQFWGGLEGEVIEKNRYKTNPELQKLQPWNSAFWIASGLSIHNYPNDFFDMVSTGKIKVHVTDVDHFSPRTVHLTTGEQLPADIIIAATGWSKDPSFEFRIDNAGIGLREAGDEKSRLVAQADAEILSRLPALRDQPKLNFAPRAPEPLRLYRYIVPPTRMAARDLAFAGMVSTVSTAFAASVQALWIAAFLDGKLDYEAETPAAVTKEVLLHTQWNKWRHPTGYGPALPDMAFDALPYMDLLIRDLGLKVNRKPSMLADLTEPYGPADFAGLVDEWKAAHGGT